MNTIDRFSTSSGGGSSLHSSLRSRGSVMSGGPWSVPSPPSSVQATTEPSRSLDLRCGSCEPSDSASQTSDQIDFIELSGEPPSQAQLDAASNVDVFDSDGNSRPFHTLFRGLEHQGQRQLLIFVRHFYCGACQAYLKALTETITPSVYFSLPIPTTITIIACGESRLLPKYGERTSCPFRMYTEPTRKLYKAFSMQTRYRFGRKPKYMNNGAVPMVLNTGKQMVQAGRHEIFKGGPIFQMGGEFLFEDGEAVWCHRMRNIRGHAEIDILKKVLGIFDGDGRESPTWSPQRDSSHLPRTSDHATHATHADDESPKPLRLIFEENGDVPRAHLARDSRDLGA